ncbi:hypothetical protein Tco_1354687 [Tanacetum coccineum]
MVLNSPCFTVKSWLVQDQIVPVQKQTAFGKDKSNPLIVDSLLKTIRLSIHLVVYNEELAILEQTATGKGISNPLMADLRTKNGDGTIVKTLFIKKGPNVTALMFTPVNTAGSSCDNLGGSIPVNAATVPNVDLPTDPLMPEDTTDFLNIGIFSGAYDDEDVGAEADFNKLVKP